MFIERRSELSALEKLYCSDEFQCVVLYGRRRVGKTALINEFCKDKPAIVFVAQEHNDSMTLKKFSEAVFAYSDKENSPAYFQDWEGALEYVAGVAKGERLILALDEFPYMAHANRSLSSIVQKIIDSVYLRSKIFLILSGSSMAFMEKEVLGYKSPLFGRRTTAMKLEEFDYQQSSEFVPGYNLADKLLAWAVFGGVPHYLGKLDETVTIVENIKQQMLSKNSYLIDEPQLLLRQELREPQVYNSIRSAIANGASRMNEIAGKAGTGNDICSKYVRNLIDLGIIARETPFGELSNSKKTLYYIADNMFAFWHRFTSEAMLLIERGKTDEAYNLLVVPQLENYTGRIFERACRQFLQNHNATGTLPFVFTKLGRWWGTDSRTRQQSEIDIIAAHAERALFTECKWQNKPVGDAVLDELIHKSALFAHSEKYFAVFSKSGFTPQLVRRAKKDQRVQLFGLEEMYV